MKSGNAKKVFTGFGGKGLDRLDKERDEKEKAERKAYGEGEEKTEERRGRREIVTLRTQFNGTATRTSACSGVLL